MKSKLKLLVVSSAPVVQIEDAFYMYGPYQKEMKIWAKHADEIQFCCPVWREDRGLLIDAISFPISNTIALKEFHIKSLAKIPLAFYYSWVNFFIILKAFRSADHIHLRCPGNIGLLACVVQILFPQKKKTAKYAGNWDPKAKQPWSYKLQRRILSNTFLTKNMQVLVYGDWPDSTKNIKPFFTATYSEKESMPVLDRRSEVFKFMYVGTLSSGKQPLYAVQMIEKLKEKGFAVVLEMYGEGVERKTLEDYIRGKSLTTYVELKGNQPKEVVKEAYQRHHFLLLPSKSEGWPKVVAEAMFWGCVPVATPVSCVSSMLDNGARGILLTMAVEQDCNKLSDCMQSEELYSKIQHSGVAWSRQYTLEAFEGAIEKLIKE